jgi:hypothetical protein
VLSAIGPSPFGLQFAGSLSGKFIFWQERPAATICQVKPAQILGVAK